MTNTNRILLRIPALTRKRVAVALEVASVLMLHSAAPRHLDDYEPVLYTEKRASTNAAQSKNRFTAIYQYMRDPLHAIHHAWHQLHQAWQRCLEQCQISI